MAKPGNLIYAQSGGVTAVINASAAAVIETARLYPDQIVSRFCPHDLRPHDFKQQQPDRLHCNQFTGKGGGIGRLELQVTAALNTTPRNGQIS